MNNPSNRFFITLALCTTIISCTDKPAENRPPASKVISVNNLPGQVFRINPERDTVIKGSSGTLLHIYKHTFTDADTAVKSDIDIELKEALKPEDIILSGLTTTTDGHFLQSGGMIYINATAGGRQLAIAKNRFVGAVIPAAKMQEGIAAL